MLAAKEKLMHSQCRQEKALYSQAPACASQASFQTISYPTRSMYRQRLLLRNRSFSACRGQAIHSKALVHRPQGSSIQHAFLLLQTIEYSYGGERESNLCFKNTSNSKTRLCAKSQEPLEDRQRKLWRLKLQYCLSIFEQKSSASNTLLELYLLQRATLLGKQYSAKNNFAYLRSQESCVQGRKGTTTLKKSLFYQQNRGASLPQPTLPSLSLRVASLKLQSFTNIGF